MCSIGAFIVIFLFYCYYYYLTSEKLRNVNVLGYLIVMNQNSNFLLKLKPKCLDLNRKCPLPFFVITTNSIYAVLLVYSKSKKIYICIYDPLCEIQAKVSKSNYEKTRIKF